MKPPLSTVCVCFAALGAALAGFFVWLIIRLSHDDGPAATGLAVAAALLLGAQAVPIAGLPAVLIARRRAEQPSPRSTARSVVWVVAAVLGIVGLGLYSVMASATIAVVAIAALFASRLGRLERGWIVAWLTLAPLSLGAGALGAWFALSILLR